MRYSKLEIGGVFNMVHVYRLADLISCSSLRLPFSNLPYGPISPFFS